MTLRQLRLTARLPARSLVLAAPVHAEVYNFYVSSVAYGKGFGEG